MKILWFSNYRFSDNAIKTTGTWIKVMGECLSNNDSIELCNVTKGSTRSVIKEKYLNIQQFVIPSQLNYTNDLPNKYIVKEIEKIIDDFNPDLIHVWGAESYWGLITMNYTNRYTILLEIQGLATQIRQHVYGGLTPMEILCSTGIKEFLKFKTHLLYQKSIYNILSKNEIRIIKKHKFISVPSYWSFKSVALINSSAYIFNSLVPLRDEFISSRATWNYQGNNEIFISSASPHAFKGLHVAIRALHVLKNNKINAKLKIAGAHGMGIRQSGYKLFLLRLIKKLKLQDEVLWLGPLNSNEIVKELNSSDAVLIPSYIESYCVALYEAVCIGTPVVCSYSGALPEVIEISDNINLFQPGDHIMAAYHLSQLFLSKSSNKATSGIHVTSERAVERQLEIYSKILEI